MNYLTLITLGIAVFILSTVFVRLFCTYAFTQGLLDIPNARSSHQEKTPRGAGLVFVMVWFLSVLMAFLYDFLPLETLLLFLPGALVVTLFGYLEDLRGLSASLRFLGQVIAASMSVFVLGGASTFHLGGSLLFYAGLGLGTFMAVLGILWSINLFNFMDGLDGLAAVEALFVFCVGGLFFWWEGAFAMAVLAWGLSAAVGGFLVWNWPRPKARIFMGDAGSYCLGFLVALFALIGDVKYNIPIALWIILYGFFWFDATVTLVRRFLKGENVLSPHCEHAYQRLHRAGFTHKQVLIGMMVLNSILSLVTLLGYRYPHYLMPILGLTVGILGGAYAWVERMKPVELKS